MRGNCGGPFPPATIADIGGRDDEEEGPFVEVSSVVSPIGKVAGDLIEYRCKSCPVACGLALEPLFRLYRATRPHALGAAGLEGRRLSAIAQEALVVIATEHEAMKALHFEEDVEKNRPKSR